MVKNYENCLLKNKIILKSQQRFKSDYHEVYTEKVNQIVLSSNDDKRLQTFDKITTYPYGANAFKVCEKEMIIVRDYLVKNYTDCPFYGEAISIWNKHKIDSTKLKNAKQAKMSFLAEVIILYLQC